MEVINIILILWFRESKLHTQRSTRLIQQDNDSLKCYTKNKPSRRINFRIPQNAVSLFVFYAYWNNTQTAVTNIRNNKRIVRLTFITANLTFRMLQHTSSEVTINMSSN